MPDTSSISTSRLPGGFLAALGVAGGFAAFVGWDQSHWWRVKEDYSFGWLVPVFTGYIIYDRWDEITARVRAAAAAAAPPAGVRWTLNTLAALGLVVGALLFLVGAFYRAGAGSSHPGTLALTLGMAGVVLPLIFFNVPIAPAAPGARGGKAGLGALLADPRLRVTLLFLFPVLVWLISAPIVSVIEQQLSIFLRHKVAVAVMFCFDLLGHPLVQQGNVLLLPDGGTVGVEDACSGIRSLTACLFAGAFLGAAFFTSLWKKLVLVGAAMAFAFLTNIGRGLFLTAWAYANGADSLSGTVHDVAGYGVLAVTCAGLLALAWVLSIRIEGAGAGEAEQPPAGR